MKPICYLCKQPILWWKEPGGRWMALNPDGARHWETCKRGVQEMPKTKIRKEAPDTVKYKTKNGTEYVN